MIKKQAEEIHDHLSSTQKILDWFQKEAKIKHIQDTTRKSKPP